MREKQKCPPRSHLGNSDRLVLRMAFFRVGMKSMWTDSLTHGVQVKVSWLGTLFRVLKQHSGAGR